MSATAKYEYHFAFIACNRKPFKHHPLVLDESTLQIEFLSQAFLPCAVLLVLVYIRVEDKIMCMMIEKLVWLKGGHI